MYPSELHHWYLTRRTRILATVAAWSLVLLGGTALYSLTCGFDGCPSAREIRAYRTSQPGRLPLARIPDHVRDAFIAVEDRRFQQHHGVDWQAMGRAMVRNVGAFEVREGGSTLTMQVARTAFIAPNACSERSWGRKLIELRLAPRIEEALTKDQIVELYLNSIYLGAGKYGIEAASRHYFGKSATRLSLSEAALLAALPKAPSVYDPLDHPERAMARRNLVLRLMAQEGYITVAQAEAAAEQEIRVARAAPSRRSNALPVTNVRRTSPGVRASSTPGC